MPRVEFAGGTRWALAHLRGVLVALVIAVAPLVAAVCTAASRIDDWPRDPAGAVTSWCARSLARDWCRPGIDSFTVTDDRLARGIHHLRIQQLWQGLPVLGGEVCLSLGDDGSVLLWTGGFLPNVRPAPPSLLAESEARRIAWDTAGPDAGRAASRATLAVRRSDRQDRLVWRVAFEGDDARPSWTTTIDATTGDVLAVERGFAPAVGLVYETDPRAPLVEKAIEGLAGSGDRLQSDWFAVENYGRSDVVRADGDFRFVPTEPDTTHFDEVNAYWHTYRFLHEFLEARGYAGPPVPIVVRVHQQLNPYVALTSKQFVALGEPILGFSRDAAKGADILYHELQHAVTWGFGVEATGDNREAASLHEALSDYMAAALTGDAGIGEWVYNALPHGATRVDRPASQFRYSNYDQLTYGAATRGSTWANGMILSGALWDLRQVIGATADSLALEALSFLPAHPLWRNFADALLEASILFHDSRHDSAVVRALVGREIIGEFPLAIEGPRQLRSGETSVFTLHSPLGAPPPTWYARQFCGTSPCGGWQPLGSGPSVVAGDTTDFELQAVTASPWGGLSEAYAFVSVRAPRLAIEGPLGFRQGEWLTFHARPTGVPPWKYDWRTRDLAPGSPAVDQGHEPAVALFFPSTFELMLSVHDGFGRTVDSSLVVRLLTLAVVGPTRVEPGRGAQFTVAVDPLVPGAAAEWQKLPWCGDWPCASGWETVGTGPSLLVTETRDYRLRVQVRYPWGSVLSESTFVDVRWPQVTIAGPLLATGDALPRFRANVDAAGYFRTDWFVTHLLPGEVERSLGSGPTVLVDEPPPYRLRVLATDYRGRTAESVLEADAAGIITTPGMTPELALDVSTPLHDEGLVRISTPGPGRCRVELLDLSGRRVMGLFDGEHPGGIRILPLRGQRLASGVYFCRLRWNGTALARRVVVVR